MGELAISEKSVGRKGLLTNEEIMVSSQSSDSSDQVDIWVVNNKRLTYSNVSNSIILSTLSEQLLLNGAKFSGGKRIGRSIWQENISFPESLD